jgi:hypothetical protein
MHYKILSPGRSNEIKLSHRFVKNNPLVVLNNILPLDLKESVTLFYDQRAWGTKKHLVQLQFDFSYTDS